MWPSYRSRYVQLYRAADAVEGDVVGGNKFVSKTVNQCGIYRQLAVVSDN